MSTDDERDLSLRLLEAAGLAEAAGEPLDIAALAGEHGRSEWGITNMLDRLVALGLVLLPDEHAVSPLLLDAGRQYLARRGEVPDTVLAFLAREIDDLVAREAILHAGAILVDDFREGILEGHGVDFAASVVPEAFRSAIDERVALDLYAAAVALMARLSAGEPAGCVAEEVIAVAVIDEAVEWIETYAEAVALGEEAVEHASDEVRGGLFELFQDDDVLNLYRMREPSDAALANHDPLNRQLGVADQRIESWFEPFGWTAPTGYLSEPDLHHEDREEDD